jgi:hypothetical protein
VGTLATMTTVGYGDVAPPDGGKPAAPVEE